MDAVFFANESILCLPHWLCVSASLNQTHWITSGIRRLQQGQSGWKLPQRVTGFKQIKCSFQISLYIFRSKLKLQNGG